MYWHGTNQHVTLLCSDGQMKKPFLQTNISQARRPAMALKLCAWRSRTTTEVSSAQQWQHQRQADVTRDGGGARGDEGKNRDTQARTVECTHSSSIRKAPTDMRVLHLTRTHASSSPLSSRLLLRQSRHCSPRATLHILPLTTSNFAPLSRDDKRASAICVCLCFACGVLVSFSCVTK